MLDKGLTLKPELTAARLRELLHYDPVTGVFTWLVRRGPRQTPGSIAGTIQYGGYRQIQLDGVIYRAHRLAWFYVHGAFPAAQLDHIDGVRDHNAIANLRPATNAENAQNVAVRADSSTGITGVCWCKKRRKWQVRIGIAGKQFNLGLFTSIQDAQAAYLSGKARLHSFQPKQRANAGGSRAREVVGSSS